MTISKWITQILKTDSIMHRKCGRTFTTGIKNIDLEDTLHTKIRKSTIIHKTLYSFDDKNEY